jgi:hypothetical protein
MAVRLRSALPLAALACACAKGQDDNKVVASTSATAPVLGVDTRVHPVGELGQGRDYSMSVESVKDCPMDPPFAPKRGNAKVGVEVSIQGTSTREVPVNVFYATVYDSRGDSYAATLAGCEPALPALRITNGQSSHGFVTFEVPKTSDKLELRYAPVVIGPGTEELKFAFNR